MPLTHLLLALAVVAIWGTNFVVIRLGLDAFAPYTFAALRYTFSFLPFIFFITRPAMTWGKLALFGVMIGVGAAFDFHSGRVRQAPRWIQRSGFEWLFRLGTEPRRLGPRYLKTNPLFALRVLAQRLGLKEYPI